jgi:hypothetical protein
MKDVKVRLRGMGPGLSVSGPRASTTIPRSP